MEPARGTGRRYGSPHPDTDPCLAILLFGTVGLALWKAIEIVWWIFKHVEVSMK